MDLCQHIYPLAPSPSVGLTETEEKPTNVNMAVKWSLCMMELKRIFPLLQVLCFSGSEGHKVGVNETINSYYLTQ